MYHKRMHHDIWVTQCMHKIVSYIHDDIFLRTIIDVSWYVWIFIHLVKSIIWCVDRCVLLIIRYYAYTVYINWISKICILGFIFILKMYILSFLRCNYYTTRKEYILILKLHSICTRYFYISMLLFISKAIVDASWDICIFIHLDRSIIWFVDRFVLLIIRHYAYTASIN